MPAEIGSNILNDNTEKLTSAITSLPQLLERKRLLDAHTSIATAILKQIKDRKLDTFFELETKLMSRAALERGVLDILLDPEMGVPEDKMRFFLIYYLMGQVEMSKVSLHFIQILSFEELWKLDFNCRVNWTSLPQHLKARVVI